MEKETIDTLRQYVEKLEAQSNKDLREIYDAHGETIALNAMLNLGTSLIAKALLMAPEEAHSTLIGVMAKLVDAKVEEGSAFIESMMTLDKAMMH